MTSLGKLVMLLHDNDKGAVQGKEIAHPVQY